LKFLLVPDQCYASLKGCPRPVLGNDAGDDREGLAEACSGIGATKDREAIMLVGYILLNVGLVLLINGLSLFDRVGQKEISVANFLAGTMFLLNSLYLAFGTESLSEKRLSGNSVL
jgi:hypothetical protein